MPPGNYFGLITGPDQSHGGYYPNEIPDVRAIQQKLIALGYVPGHSNINDGWASGKFEQSTADAVTRFQHAQMPGTQFYGQVWPDDWRKLFSL
jgi:peptidoglycan hydrolase-like protein with peptidoglycan-binding domain